jgi:sulfotransferase
MKSEGKRYHFLAGLPRSGNTLLSAILNQNPQIYSSPLSPLDGYYYDLENKMQGDEHVIRNKNNDNSKEIFKNLIVNYYQNINKPIIIDREKAWGVGENLNLIKKYITPTPKIIFTTRPIVEILASFITLLPEHSYIDMEMRNTRWWYKDYLTKDDNRCDYLMRPYGGIDQTLLTFNEIRKSENKNIFCLVKYDDLTNNPQDTMKNIYNFLELPDYKHDFNKIQKLEKDNDEVLGHPSNLHEVRPKLKKVSKDPKEVLSEYVINKYSNIGWEA